MKGEKKCRLIWQIVPCELEYYLLTDGESEYYFLNCFSGFCSTDYLMLEMREYFQACIVLKIKNIFSFLKSFDRFPRQD